MFNPKLKSYKSMIISVLIEDFASVAEDFVNKLPDDGQKLAEKLNIPSDKLTWERASCSKIIYNEGLIDTIAKEINNRLKKRIGA